jgi:hypothetical protein
MPQSSKWQSRRKRAPRGPSHLLTPAGNVGLPALARLWRLRHNTAYTSCKDTVWYDLSTESPVGTTINGGTATGLNAMQNWEAVESKTTWTFTDGGSTLPEGASFGSLQVELSASSSAGGAIVYGTLNGASPPSSGYVNEGILWVQALVAITYEPLGSINYPYKKYPITTLDTEAFSQDPNGDNAGFPTYADASYNQDSVWTVGSEAQFGPQYPFQYGSTMATNTCGALPCGNDPFLDGPQGVWQAPGTTVVFNALAFPVLVNQTGHTLTYYDDSAISYSFELTTSGMADLETADSTAAVPEVSTYAMMALGFVGLWRFRRGLT